MYGSKTVSQIRIKYIFMTDMDIQMLKQRWKNGFLIQCGFYFIFFIVVAGFTRSNTLKISGKMENTNMPGL